MPKFVPFFRYYGGKANKIKYLLKFVPSHEYYLEMFGGAGNLLLAKEPAVLEVYNDIDSDLVNLFRVVRDEEKFERFRKKVELTLYSREEFIFCQKTYELCDDEVERAYRFYICLLQCFSGVLKGGWSYSIKEKNKGLSSSVSKYLSKVKNLENIYLRLRTVQIENLDFRDCFKKYIAKWEYDNSFCYCDPPYLPETRKDVKSYSYEMTRKDHEDFIDLLLRYNKNCKFLVSGYESDLYKELEKNGWKRYDFYALCSSIKKKGENICLEDKEKYYRKEILWFNF